MARIYNWVREPEDDRDMPSVRHMKALGIEMPAEFELPAQIPVYDQGEIGSCTANSGCASFRFEWFQLKNNFNFDPSRLFVYYNTRLLEGTTNEDAGAYVRDVFKSMKNFGVSDEKFWTYDESFTKKPSDAAYTDGKTKIVVKYTFVEQNLEKIKQTLYSGACVIFGFDVYSSFESGNWDRTTGIMPIPTPKKEQFLGGHCVTIIGWSESKKCFLIQNSWGEGWGQKGKFWMPYSYLLDPTHADDFWCIDEISVDENPTPDPTPTPDADLLKIFKSIFATQSELKALKTSSLYELGVVLGLPVSTKNKKSANLQIIADFLNIKLTKWWEF